MVHYVYRDRWCIAADYVITHSKRGTVYVWVLSTGHLERCFAANTKECNYFLKSRGLLAQRSQVFVSPSTYAAEHGTTHASFGQVFTPRSAASAHATSGSGASASPTASGSASASSAERKSPASANRSILAPPKSPASELIHVVPFPGYVATLSLSL